MLIGSLFKQLACLYSFLCVFPLFEKLGFIKLDSFSTDPRQISIYQALWTSFLDISYCILDLSRFLAFVLIASQQILDPSRNFLSGRQILDRFSIHRGWLLLDSSLTTSQSVETLLHALFFFSHVLHLSIILSFIVSCFITFMLLHRFIVPP